MPFRDILVCLDPSHAGEARLRLAAGLASEQRAHLSAVYILPQQEAEAGIAADDGLGFHAPTETRRGVFTRVSAASKISISRTGARSFFFIALTTSRELQKNLS